MSTILYNTVFRNTNNAFCLFLFSSKDTRPLEINNRKQKYTYIRTNIFKFMWKSNLI